MAGQYTKDTEAWFAPYKQHAAVACFQSLHNQYGISYDAVMSMAIHLDIDNPIDYPIDTSTAEFR
jgi:hypothetical protein